MVTTKPGKKNSSWTGNTSAKKKERRIELGQMNFDEKDQWYKQDKAINGGGTRHLVMCKDTTVKDVKDMAEKEEKSFTLFYLQYIEPPQAHVEISKTVG